jgi:hypothetical protein
MWRRFKRTAVAPDKDCIEHGEKLFCLIHRGASSRDGEVRDEQGTVRWRFGIRANPSNWGLGNPLKKPDFVLSEPDQKNETIIRRASFVPSVFKILEAGELIGTVRMQSVFLNQYSISIVGVDTWTFRMPLYTIFFFGESRAGCEIWVRVGPSEKEWNLLIKAGVTRRPLVAALAFIHNERYFHS